MLKAGTVVHDRYRVVRLIGRGGMGAVYEALDSRLGCTVALKQTLATPGAGDDAFEREARLLAALRHPVLPVVSDFFAHEGSQFLVMQFIPGEDLRAILERRTRGFAWQEVLAWMPPLLDGLEYLHGHTPPIVHRDIKPGNLKLTDRGELILLDFGLAKGRAAGRERWDPARSIRGYTPQYSPLEQIEGHPTDPRSDLFALGATIYHLLTNVVPPHALERAYAVASGQPDALRDAHLINPDIPASLSAVIRRAMALKPADRFSSVREMRSALMAEAARTNGRRAGAASTRETLAKPETPAPKPRRIDAAAPARAELARPIDVLVQVRFADSPRLGLEDWPGRVPPAQLEQVSEPVSLTYPLDLRTGALRPARIQIKVVAPDFIVEGQALQQVEVPPYEYSKRVAFLLTPTRAGLCRINVEVYGPDALYLGAVPVETDVGGEVAQQPELRVAALMLGVFVEKMAALLGPDAGLRPSPPGAPRPPASPGLPGAPPPPAMQPEADSPGRPIRESGRERTRPAPRSPAAPGAIPGHGEAPQVESPTGYEYAASPASESLPGHEAAPPVEPAGYGTSPLPESSPGATPLSPPAAIRRQGVRWVRVAAPGAVLLLVAAVSATYLSLSMRPPVQLASRVAAPATAGEPAAPAAPPAVPRVPPSSASRPGGPVSGRPAPASPTAAPTTAPRATPPPAPAPPAAGGTRSEPEDRARTIADLRAAEEAAKKAINPRVAAEEAKAVAEARARIPSTDRPTLRLRANTPLPSTNQPAFTLTVSPKAPQNTVLELRFDNRTRKAVEMSLSRETLLLADATGTPVSIQFLADCRRQGGMLRTVAPGTSVVACVWLPAVPPGAGAAARDELFVFFRPGRPGTAVFPNFVLQLR